ncbi:hypothetical protein ACVOMS_03245 [Bradyrhizobium guangxiense]
MARTTTEGGTTSGYSEIGIANSEISPARKISTERTPAKIGRSMKNFERFMVLPLGNIVRFSDHFAVIPGRASRASPESRGGVVGVS